MGHALPAEIEVPDANLGNRHTLLGRLSIPLCRCSGITRDTGPLQVKRGDIDLGGRIALFGGLLKPFARLAEFLRNAVAACVEAT